MGQGQAMAEAVRAIGVTETTYFRWRSEYGGLKLDLGDFAARNAEVRRLKLLEPENTRLRRVVAELTLEKLVLKEAASGNF